MDISPPPPPTGETLDPPPISTHHLPLKGTANGLTLLYHIRHNAMLMIYAKWQISRRHSL